jgi:hypothetical protein
MRKLDLLAVSWRAKYNLIKAFVNLLAVSAASLRSRLRPSLLPNSSAAGYVTRARLQIKMSIIPSDGLFIHSRKGYKQPFLKGRFYGEEEEKAARVDFRRGP